MLEVRLTTSNQASADILGRKRQAYAEERGFRVSGVSSLQTHLLGAAGEMAVAQWLGIQHPALQSADGYTWEQDKARGHDVGGYQVRTRSSSTYDLNLHRGDTGRFVLVLGHAAPTMHIVGWIDAEDGFRLGAWRNDGEGNTRWCLVPRRHLHSIEASRWLIDPQTPFWCEVCGGLHPIIEHRRCRALEAAAPEF